jgi:hypothetical protein
VFHVELRRFPHVARVFNLDAEELQGRIVLPWIRGAAVELEDRRWTRDRARLTIYEGPEIAAEDRGLGRGWSTVTRDGQNVTAWMIAAAGELVPKVSGLKRALLAAPTPLPLSEVASLAGSAGRPSERLAAAEQAVWELLHEGRASLTLAGAPVQRAEWESVLLRWETWADPDGSAQLDVATPTGTADR